MDLKIKFSAYHEGNQKEMLPHFNQIFATNRNLEHWDWKFKNNPYGAPISYLAWETNHETLVGQLSLLRVKLNFFGSPLDACQIVDGLVSNPYRKQGIFETTANSCFEDAQSQGIHATFGFPNQYSTPGFIRKLSFRRVNVLKHYIYRLNYEELLSRSFKNPWVTKVIAFPHKILRSFWSFFIRKMSTLKLHSKTSFQIDDQVPKNYEKFWDHYKFQEGLCVWKDTQYLEWRYDQNPDHHFKYFSLTEGNEILAIVVVLEEPGRARICEFMSKNHNVSVGRHLLHQLIAYYSACRDLSVIDFFGFDAGFFDDALIDFNRKSSYSNILCVRLFQTTSHPDLFYHSQNWSVSFGDIDSA